MGTFGEFRNSELEETIKSFNLVPDGSIHDQELKAFETFLRRDHSTDAPPDISDLLDIASSSASNTVRRSIHDSFLPHQGQEKKPDLPLLVRRIQGVILPPDTNQRPIHGEGTFEPVRFEERLLELTKLLEREQVFLDDYIVTIGSLSPSQMRQASYAVVEIPKINRTILVCDQVGEATFVIHGIGDPRRFLTLTKEELLTTLGASARKVIRNNPAQWHSDLGILLFTEDGWNTNTEEQTEQQTEQQSKPQTQSSQKTPRRKLDVREIADIRDAIFQTEYGTPHAWVKMTQPQAKAFKLPDSLGELGIIAIASRFGVEGSPYIKPVRLDLGIQIFGEDPILVKVLADLTAIRAAEKAVTNEQIIAYIKTIHTPESWGKMTTPQALAFKLPDSLGGLGLFTIRTRFGVDGDPVNKTRVRLELGIQIFGDDPILIKALADLTALNEAEKEVTNEQIIAYIKTIHTPESWATMTWDQAIAFKLPDSLGGLGLKAITSRFGEKGNPIKHKYIRLELGKKILGEDPILVKALADLEALQTAEKAVTKEQIIAYIKTIHTPKSWVKMIARQAKVFKLSDSLGGLGLDAIARRFGVEGSPNNNTRVRLELGRKIFGEEAIERALENMKSTQ